MFAWKKWVNTVEVSVQDDPSHSSPVDMNHASTSQAIFAEDSFKE